MLTSTAEIAGLGLGAPLAPPLGGGGGAPLADGLGGGGTPREGAVGGAGGLGTADVVVEEVEVVGLAVAAELA